MMTRYFSYLIFILVYQSFAIFSLPSGFKLFCFFVLRMSLINSIKLGFRLQSPSPCLVQGKLTLYVFTVTLDVIRIILICILFLFCFAFLLFPSPSGLCWNGKVLSLQLIPFEGCLDVYSFTSYERLPKHLSMLFNCILSYKVLSYSLSLLYSQQRVLPQFNPPWTPSIFCVWDA